MARDRQSLVNTLESVNKILNSRLYAGFDRYQVNGQRVNPERAIHALRAIARQGLAETKTRVFLVTFRPQDGTFTYGTPVEAVNRLAARDYILAENPGAEILAVQREAR